MQRENELQAWTMAPLRSSTAVMKSISSSASLPKGSVYRHSFGVMNEKDVPENSRFLALALACRRSRTSFNLTVSNASLS